MVGTVLREIGCVAKGHEVFDGVIINYEKGLALKKGERR